MSESLQSWPRSYYEPGGGQPDLFYVVYGEIDKSAALSSSRYRVQNKPAELEVMAYGPSAHPEVVNSFCAGLLWERLKQSDPQLAADIARQKSCFVARGAFSDSPTLDYLRDTIGLVTHCLDHGGVAVYDPHMFQWWTPTKWHERIFEPASAVPRHHVVILISENKNDTLWVHTRGLRKFGRPDISIPRVAAKWREGAIDLCNRFIEFQAFGGLILEGKEITMRSLPDGLRCYHRGYLDDPDFNNVHVAIET